MGEHDEENSAACAMDDHKQESECVQPEGATTCSDKSTDCAVKELTCSLTGMAPLFTPLTLGSLSLTHRIILAPLTRLRASPDGVPNTQLASEYYGQRATKGGLLVTEATYISQQATGYYRGAGIYTPAQVEAWKGVTAAVHKKGGFIILQVYHTGRAAHSSLQQDGSPPVGASPIAITGEKPLPGGKSAPYQVPHELTVEEISAMLEDYRKAAKNAALAGFDGVEIHGANGYLVDQFLHNSSNQRKDKYGGSIENRSRFPLEVLTTVKQGWKEGVGESSPLVANVGIRFSPFGKYLDMSDTEESELFRYLIPKISELSPAYLHLVEPRVIGNYQKGETEADAEHVVYSLGRLFNGPVITAGGYRPDNANRVVYNGYHADHQQHVGVAFGRLFIANPDLPLRIFLRAPIHYYDRATFYTHEAVGYTDQPFLDQEVVKTHIEELRRSAPDNEKLQKAIDGEVQLLKAH